MKAAGWMVGLAVLVGIGILMVSTGCEKGKSAASTTKPGQKTMGGPLAGDKTYAELNTMAQDMQKKYEAATAAGKLPQGATPPPPPWKMLTGLNVKDKGTVLSTETVNGRNFAMIDVDGDGKPDVRLDIAGKTATQGSAATFAGKIQGEDMVDGKLTLEIGSATFSEAAK
jgi:hypothetical protein